MRRLARRKLRQWLHALLHTHDSAPRTALAFATGVFVGFLPPVPYLHTVLALVLAFVFRLNRIAALLGAYTNTVFTMLPILAAEISIGVLILGGQGAPELTWGQFNSWAGWGRAASELRPFLAPMLLGSLVLGLIAAGIAYIAAVRVVTAYRHHASRVRQEAQAELELAPPGPIVDSPADRT